VISYLVFGRPASELGGSEQKGVDHAAAAMAAGMAAAELQRALGDALPFDTLDINYDQSGAGEVGVGKYIHRDVFVRYGHSLGDEADDEIQIEWRLDEHWSLQNTVSRRDSGGDVVFTIEY
jgi:autotransporter translocation and assembly factor TamB